MVAMPHLYRTLPHPRGNSVAQTVRTCDRKERKA
jgi:hypothetical protein